MLQHQRIPASTGPPLAIRRFLSRYHLTCRRDLLPECRRPQPPPDVRRLGSQSSQYTVTRHKDTSRPIAVGTRHEAGPRRHPG